MRRRHAFGASLLSVLLASCLQARMVVYNYPDLTAPTYFASREITPSPHPVPFREEHPRAHFRTSKTTGEGFASFDEFLLLKQTRAFVVLHEDSVVYERYFEGVSRTTLFPSFSIAKAFAGLTVGAAIEDGILHSVDDPITRYVPELRQKPGYKDVTLDHLLRMVSGIDFEEESTAGATFYYSHELRRRLYAYDVKWKPGTHFLYGGLNIELVWDALQHALGNVAFSTYFQHRIWDRLGAEHAASWSLDSEASGIEKFWAGLNATARDFARLGLVYLNQGKLHEHALVSPAWVARSIEVDPVVGPADSTDGLVYRSKYQWLLTTDGRGYFAKGYQGQYVFVVPSRRMVFVRFGEGYAGIDWPKLFVELADSYAKDHAPTKTP